jgi:hypothetical protein
MVRARREAPITATDRGSNIARMLRAAPIDARVSMARRAASVSRTGNHARTVGPRRSDATSKPTYERRSIIIAFDGTTSASKRSMPRREAAAASCSRRAVPTPRRFHSSTTPSANSARGTPSSAAGIDRNRPAAASVSASAGP